MAKTPSPIDKHVGSRLRMRRMMLGMSQGKLGEALGITFQQVQKYEKGVNRMGASRLQQAAQNLGVSVPFFFEGAPGGHKLEARRSVAGLCQRVHLQRRGAETNQSLQANSEPRDAPSDRRSRAGDRRRLGPVRLWE